MQKRPDRPQVTRGSAGEPRGPLTPADWIAGATELLVSDGIEAVRVDVLARRIGVTRGSFYWHFKDRDDLLRHMLDAWRHAATGAVDDRRPKAGEIDDRRPKAGEAMRALMMAPCWGGHARQAAGVELAMRGWARRDPNVRRAVAAVDQSRIACLAQSLTALGFSDAEAQDRAFALYAYQVAESVLSSHGSAARKAARRALVERLILTQLPHEPAPGGGGPRRRAARAPRGAG
jgi:AcrR family transcriptional regulator